ncbi:MAG: histidine phosphatase family protein [Parvularculaceae bacterium]
MARLIVLRHGNTFEPGDVVTRIGARTDPPLSRSGREQANAAGEALVTRGFRIGTILSSPLSRAIETAGAVRDRVAPDLDIEPIEALREIDYGPDENRPEAEVVARVGAAAIAAWDADAAPAPGWTVDVAAIKETWGDLFDRFRKRRDDALVVTSNGVARFVLDVADEVPPGASRKLKTAAFGVVDLADGAARLTNWNVRG